jgi:hypothetical protein
MKMLLFISLIAATILAGACSKDDSMVDTNNGGMVNDSTFVSQSSGTFTGQNGYEAKGTISLGANAINPAIVQLATDFNASLQTGAVTLYLSKNQQLKLSDAATILRVSLVSKPGLQQFVLAAQPSTDFRYAILWCASAGVQFGYAELK